MILITKVPKMRLTTNQSPILKSNPQFPLILTIPKSLFNSLRRKIYIKMKNIWLQKNAFTQQEEILRINAWRDFQAIANMLYMVTGILSIDLTQFFLLLNRKLLMLLTKFSFQSLFLILRLVKINFKKFQLKENTQPSTFLKISILTKKFVSNLFIIDIFTNENYGINWTNRKWKVLSNKKYIQKLIKCKYYQYRYNIGL